MSPLYLSYYKPRHFSIEELVPKILFEKFGQNALQFFDPYILHAADGIRDIFGPVYVNNWDSGGSLDSCGLRLPDDKTGAQYSLHKFGKALDLHFRDTTPEQVIEFIKQDQNEWPCFYLTAIETGTKSWVHIDRRNIKNRLMLIPSF